jgi:hypothetical protein
MLTKIKNYEELRTESLPIVTKTTLWLKVQGLLLGALICFKKFILSGWWSGLSSKEPT